MQKPKVVIVIPAYNCERTIREVYRKIPRGLANEVIVVDDGSKGNTVTEIKGLGLRQILLLVEYILHRFKIKKADFLTA